MTVDARQTPVTAEMISEAIQILILRNDTHFDSLMARLNEERVRRVIEPVIIGGTTLGAWDKSPATIFASPLSASFCAFLG